MGGGFFEVLELEDDQSSPVRSSILSYGWCEVSSIHKSSNHIVQHLARSRALKLGIEVAAIGYWVRHKVLLAPLTVAGEYEVLRMQELLH